MQIPEKIIVRFDGPNGEGFFAIGETPNEIIVLVTGKNMNSTKCNFYKDKSPECCRILKELIETMQKEGGVEILKESMIKFMEEIKNFEKPLN